MHIPFDTARVFYVHHVAPGVDRGGHAHRDSDQVLSYVAGRMKVDVSDGAGTKTFVLDDAATGLFVPRMVWIRPYDFDERAVLAVYANTPYDRSRSSRRMTTRAPRSCAGRGGRSRSPRDRRTHSRCF